jgi:hypothetical protein
MDFLIIIGISYILLGLTNYKIERVDRFYRLFWGMERPSNRYFIRIGFLIIMVAIFFHFLINFF